MLESSLADVSFLDGMLVEKFCYHQPLYRQHQRLRVERFLVRMRTP